MTELERLLEIKEWMQQNNQDEEYCIETKNRETNWQGEATFTTRGPARIMVFEGNGDGSDDATYTYEEFVEKYDFDIRRDYV